MELTEYKLSEVCDILRSGKGLSSNCISTEGLYPVYGGNGLRGYTSSYNFEGSCALVGRQGAYCGNVHYITGKTYVTEHAIIISPNDKANTRFLYFLLSKLNLGSLSSQSAQPGISVKSLSEQHILLPKKAIQDKIAKILGDLDDKIYINNEINDNLAA